MSTAIRICHLSSVHQINDTRVFHRECVSLVKHFEVYLIAIGTFSGQKEGVNIIGIQKPKWRLIRLFFTTWQVFFYALRVNAKLYHIHDGELLPFAWLLKLFGKKVIYDIHENTYQDFAYKPWIPKPLKNILAFLYKSIECFSSRFIHFLLVIAKPELANRFCVKDYTIVQNFADRNMLLPYSNKQRSVLAAYNVFYMGSIHSMYYDFNQIVEAIYLIQKTGLNVHLHVAGDSENYQNELFKAHARYHDVKQAITFHGFISPDEAYKISMQCKVGICLKNQPDEIILSHERKFFEYMALGMPIICANAGIYKDVLKRFPFGIAVNLDDPFEIATALKKIVTAKEELDQLSRMAIEASTHHDWEIESQKLVRCYKQLLA